MKRNTIAKYDKNIKKKNCIKIRAIHPIAQGYLITNFCIALKPLQNVFVLPALTFNFFFKSFFPS